VKLKPVYRVEFTYPESWTVELEGPSGKEEQHFFIAEGRCEGRLAGRFRGANHPQRRTDHTFVPDFQGVIEADDGATVFFDYRGYGRRYPEGADRSSVPPPTWPTTSAIAGSTTSSAPAPERCAHAPPGAESISCSTSRSSYGSPSASD